MAEYCKNPIKGGKIAPGIPRGSGKIHGSGRGKGSAGVTGGASYKPHFPTNRTPPRPGGKAGKYGTTSRDF